MDIWVRLPLDIVQLVEISAFFVQILHIAQRENLLQRFEIVAERVLRFIRLHLIYGQSGALL